MEELIKDFELLTEIATDLSLQFVGVETDSRKRKTSTYFLAKLVHSSRTLNRLLPSSDEEQFDFPSIASICRNIIELTNLCWYYCIDDTSELEEEFRFLLYDLHDSASLIAIFKNLGFELDDSEKLEQEKINLRNMVVSHSMFQTLHAGVQTQIKKGKKSTLLNQNQMAECRRINITEFQGIYKLLSTHIHSTGTSINQVVYTQLYSSEMDKAFLGLTLHYTSSFVAQMVKSIGEMWGIEFAKDESSEFIDHYASQLY